MRRRPTLGAAEHPVIDLRMELGSASESVTISADAPLINSGTATVGQTITTKEVEDLPINGRTPMMLAHLAFGVISTFEPGPIRPFDNGAANSVSIGGAPTGTNEVLLNGSPNAGFQKQMAYSPPHDAVMEVRVNAFESDASYGHTGGGTVNLITKSGTNAFHGTAYEFNQSSVMDANSFFTNKAGNPRPAYHYNQYGVTAGGPVWVPKVFNGRNRVFWFFGWEGLRDSDPANSPLETGSPVNFATVPTNAERGGDFSALLNSRPGFDYRIYDPLTGVASGSNTARTPFPNNVIPAARLNSIAQKYLQFFPTPSGVGRADGFQNYVVNAIDLDGYDNELGRIDFNVTDRDRLFFDARHNYRAQDKNNYFHNIATGTFLYRINQAVSADNVYTLNSTTVLETRASWTRYIENRGMPNDGFNPSTGLGFPAYIAGTSQGLQLPAITFTSTSVTAGSQSSFQSLGGNGDGSQVYDTYQLFGNLVKAHGNHALKIGVDARKYIWSAFSQGNSAGQYTFGSTTATSNWTNGSLNNSALSPLGQDFAAFLLGLPSSGTFDLNSRSTTQSKYIGIFAQDDWRARRDLTLNIGLRFEHETPSSERYDRAVRGFDPSASNPISAAAAAAYAANPNTLLPASQFHALGGLAFVNGGDHSIYHTSSGYLSPRFGFAWTPRRLGAGTVVRGGFAVFVSPIEIIGNGATGNSVSLNQQGFSQSTAYVATNDSFRTPATTLSDPFPTGFVAPAGSSKGTGTFLGQGISFYMPDARSPYAMRWNFGIQRELPGHIVMEVAYIGNHAVRLPINTQLDSIPRQYLSTLPTRDNALNTLLTGTVPNPLRGLLPNSTSLNGSTVALQQLLIPFPQYPVGSGTSNGVVLQGNPAGSSYYHSLNVRLQKRFTNGLTFINNFIWNRLTDRTMYLNDTDSAPAKRIAGDSRPLREVLAGTYDLPVGRGRRIDLGHAWANTILGGWKFNGTLILQSGPVIGLGNVVYFGGPLNFDPHQPDGNSFDTSQFVTLSNQQLVFNIRTLPTQFNNFRRDHTEQVDLSMGKKFGLWSEQRHLEMRFEAFNVSNRVTFGSPNTTATSTAFGTIATQANTPRRLQVGARLVW